MSMSALAAASLARFFSASASSAFLSEDPARRPSSSSSSRPSERPTRPTPPRTSPRSSSLPRFRPTRSRESSLAPRGASRDPPRRAPPPRRSSSRCRRSRERLLSRRRSRSRERERDLLLPPSRSRERDRPIRRRDWGCSERWGRRASFDVICVDYHSVGRKSGAVTETSRETSGGGCDSRHRVHRASHPPAERTQTPAHLPRTSHRGSHPRARSRSPGRRLASSPERPGGGVGRSGRLIRGGHL